MGQAPPSNLLKSLEKASDGSNGIDKALLKRLFDHYSDEDGKPISNKKAKIFAADVIQWHVNRKTLPASINVPQQVSTRSPAPPNRAASLTLSAYQSRSTATPYRYSAAFPFCE